MKKGKKETGLHLQAYVPDEGRKQKKVQILGLVPILYMILGVYGWMRTALGIAQISVDRSAYAALFLLGIWFGMIYLIKKRSMLLLLATTLAAGIALWQNLESVIEGFWIIGRAFAERFAEQNAAASVLGGNTEIVCALMTAGFLLYCIFLGCFCTEVGKYFAVFFLLLPFCGAFLCGQIPEQLGSFCMLFSALGLITASAEEHDSTQNLAAVGFGILALLLFAGAALSGETLLRRFFEEKEVLRTEIQQTSLIQEADKLTQMLQIKKNGAASGGVSEGTINDTDFFRNTGEILFSVSQSEEPQSNLYLRVYTGGKYTNTQWKTVKDKEPKQVFYERMAEKAADLGYSGPTTLAIGFLDGKEDTIHAYAPYFSHLEKTQQGQKTYAYYPLSWIPNLFAKATDKKSTDYKNDVYKQYLAYPKKGTERMQEFVAENPSTDLEEISNKIRKFLSEQAIYNPQTGRFPEEENFAEYFLFEKKEGYCVHFATAAALLMRMYGVPARYVTGFTVPAADFYWQENVGWQANVKDERAHAWAEIYTEQYGWIPFETTPSYDSGAALTYESGAEPEHQTEKTEESEVKNQEMTEKNQEMQEEQAENPKKETENTEKTSAVQQIVGMLLAFFLLIVVFILGLFARRGILLRRRMQASAAEIFRDLYEVLVFAGMPNELDVMDETFSEKVTEQFLWIQKEEMDAVCELAMRANFAKEAVSREETLQMRGFYRYVCRMTWKGMNWKKRFQFRFIKVYA